MRFFDRTLSSVIASGVLRVVVFFASLTCAFVSMPRTVTSGEASDTSKIETPDSHHPFICWVKSRKANMRSTPSKSGLTVSSLWRGAKGFATKRREDWYYVEFKVTLENNIGLLDADSVRAGWMHESVLSREYIEEISLGARLQSVYEESLKKSASTRRQQAITDNRTWDSQTKESVLRGAVSIGMTAEMVRASWGPPEDVNRSVGSWGVYEQWVYGDHSRFLYFENGVLVSLQD